MLYLQTRSIDEMLSRSVCYWMRTGTCPDNRLRSRSHAVKHMRRGCLLRQDRKTYDHSGASADTLYQKNSNYMDSSGQDKNTLAQTTSLCGDSQLTQSLLIWRFMQMVLQTFRWHLDLSYKFLKERYCEVTDCDKKKKVKRKTSNNLKIM